MRARSRPSKRVDQLAAYPEKAKASRVEGTVVLELTVDEEGNVTAVKVLRSVPGLDEAAVEAAKGWKYEPSDSDSSRTFREPVTFELEKTPEPKDERSLENLSFQEARGYWRNTYVPGDPMIRLLEALERTRELGDRFRLVVAGRGAAELLGPEAFRRGPLSVALDDLLAKEENSGLPLQQAVALAMERVHAGDDPTMPLGTSLLLLVTSRSLSDDVEPVAALAHRSAARTRTESRS